MWPAKRKVDELQTVLIPQKIRNKASKLTKGNSDSEIQRIFNGNDVAEMYEVLAKRMTTVLSSDKGFNSRYSLLSKACGIDEPSFGADVMSDLWKFLFSTHWGLSYPDNKEVEKKLLFEKLNVKPPEKLNVKPPPSQGRKKAKLDAGKTLPVASATVQKHGASSYELDDTNVTAQGEAAQTLVSMAATKH